MSDRADSSASSAPGRRPRRRGWRAFLTPGWVLTTVLAVAFAYIAFTVLAPWQLGKNTDTQHFNDRLEAAMKHGPVPVSTVLPADGGPAGDDAEWTRVELQGRFLPESEVLLRNRPVSSSPAFQVLTPFRTDDGLTVLVNRGWIKPTGGGAGVPEMADAPATETTVTGYVRKSEAVPDSAPITDQGRLQVYGMNTAQISRLTGLDLAGSYVQLDEASAAGRAGEGLAAIPLPKLDSGPYLSYGIQWIAFGIMVPLGLGYFVWAEIRERRRQREEVAAAEAGVQDAGDSAEPDPAAACEVPELPDAPDAVTVSRERKLADRYGHGRNRAFSDRDARDEERF
ncbi:SURF1 family protein [uncultured Corynebacterium sp.]|uniref:SURF1 family cytochrome oxidase biogenesis protein n=1 Tax=uncultured Corynebacterium sp. TaxID=159447 RepID=UPI0025F6D59F|nr:SURF1 family protein [uncultured Corynebacterium sp.]